MNGPSEADCHRSDGQILKTCCTLSAGFTTGGTLHIVVNNQIGFTTTPSQARSSPHPTDFAKCIGAPILHVNADDPEAVVKACCIAADWRATFHRDVVVDLVGFRRRGHNELDGPHTTLPWSYNLIDQHPTALELYSRQLERQGLASADKVKQMRVSFYCSLSSMTLSVKNSGMLLIH